MAEEQTELTEEELKQKVHEILDSSIEEKEKIKKLHLELGYSRVQLCREFGFPRATVYRELPVKPQKQSANKNGKEDEDSVPKLPVVLKTGKGQEVISPEGILQKYLLNDGDSGVAMLKGMMLLRAAQLMVMSDVEIMKGQAEAQSKAIQPILEIMEQARRDMDAAAQRAKESNIEIAQLAAAGASARAVSHIDERFEEMKQQKADVATVPKPFEGLFARVMETALTGLMSRIAGTAPGQGISLPPGWSDNRNKEVAQ